MSEEEDESVEEEEEEPFLLAFSFRPDRQDAAGVGGMDVRDSVVVSILLGTRRRFRPDFPFSCLGDRGASLTGTASVTTPTSDETGEEEKGKERMEEEAADNKESELLCCAAVTVLNSAAARSRSRREMSILTSSGFLILSSFNGTLWSVFSN